MNPRSKSVWMTPAASGALAPVLMVQALVSFSPVVRYVLRPSNLYTERIIVEKPLSTTPMSAKNSLASSGDISMSSSSMRAEIIITSAPWVSSAYCWTLATIELSDGLFIVSARSSSDTLHAKIVRFEVRRKNSFIISQSSSFISAVIAGFPASRCGKILSMTSSSLLASLSFPLDFFSRDTLRFVNEAWSAKMSSALMISMSLRGSTVPNSWMISSSSKQRTTCTIASVSRILAKNLLPRPAPSEAPWTNPAISTNSIAAGMTFSELDMLLRTSNLESGTVTTPTFGSIVQKG